MRVDFEFDKNLVETSQHTMEDIYGMIKRKFDAKNIPCVSDGEILSFEGTGDKNDFSNMLVTIDDIAQTEWFLNLATACIWRRDENKWEDILKQVKKEKGVEGWEAQAERTTKREHIRHLYNCCQDMIECYMGSDEEFSGIENENEREFYLTIRDLFMKQKQRKLVENGVF